VLVGLAFKVDFNTLGQQPLAAMLTAAGQDGAAILGFHTCAESELLFPRTFRGLVSAFHNSNFPKRSFSHSMSAKIARGKRERNHTGLS
jgi:hypothetical protein